FSVWVIQYQRTGYRIKAKLQGWRKNTIYRSTGHVVYASFQCRCILIESDVLRYGKSLLDLDDLHFKNIIVCFGRFDGFFHDGGEGVILLMTTRNNAERNGTSIVIHRAGINMPARFYAAFKYQSGFP